MSHIFQLKSLLAAVCFTAAVAVFWSRTGPDKEERVFITYGEQLGQKIAEQVEMQSVIVLTSETAKSHPASEAMISELLSALERSDIQIAGRIEVSARRADPRIPLDYAAPAELYRKAVEQYPNAGCILSFVGPPDLLAYMGPGVTPPPVILAGGLSTLTGLEPYFRQSIITLAVLRKPHTTFGRAEDQYFDRRWLDRNFALVSTENYGNFIDYF